MQELGVSFTSDKQKIKPNETVTLSWKVQGADSIFISGVGSVPREGNKEITLTDTTEFTMVVEGWGVASVTKLKIIVEGGRGPNDYPKDLNVFRFPITFKRSVAWRGDALGQIHTILQDRMKFSVDEHASGDDFVFLTNISQRDELVDPSENRIRFRTLSYLVTVGKQDPRTKEIPITISTFIQYVRGGEGTPRNETSDTVHRKAADLLRSFIEGRQ